MNEPQSPPEFFDEHLRRGRLEEARALLDEYPNFWETYDVVTGDTPFHMLTELGITSRCKWALENGAKIDTPNRDGMTALHAAANIDDGDMVDFIVSQGAAIEAQDKDGHTPLLYACAMGCEMAIEHLLKAGANDQATDKRGFGMLGVFLSSSFFHDWDQATATADWLEGQYTQPGMTRAALKEAQAVKVNGTCGKTMFPGLVSAIEAAELHNASQATPEPSQPRRRF